MSKYNCIAMLLAGGEGKRLGGLTLKNAKPAVLFGGKYRIIDFSLSNCTNSGIDTIGVLIQYEPLILNSYIGIGKTWDLHRKNGGVSILPPYVDKQGVRWYKGTANAVYQNIYFMEQFQPSYVLILSGDHIYKMDYREMLALHIEKEAEITIAVKEVSWGEAGRFGIMKLDSNNRIIEFQEKPKKPNSNLASMGIYIFKWEILKEYLIKDNNNRESSNDFGKNVIPLMLQEKRRMFGFNFSNYWRDVGTLRSYYEANMDLLGDYPSLNLNDHDWMIYSSCDYYSPQFIGSSAKITKSLINEGCYINGTVNNSIIFPGVTIKKGAIINNSIIMPNVDIGIDVTLNRVIVAENVSVTDYCKVDNHKKNVLLIEGGFDNN